MKRVVIVAVFAALVVPATAGAAVRAHVAAHAVRHDLSRPLRDLRPSVVLTGRPVNRPLRRVPHAQAGLDFGLFGALATLRTATTTPLLSFDGMGDGFSGPGGTLSVNSAPPDPEGDVGPNHYVQAVNTSLAVFNKSGTPVYGPVPLNTLWSGFGGGCQTNNDGDPSVRYDPIADRWIIGQFSVSSAPYLMCIAVSQTPDPTGAYYRYAFSYGNTDFPDYPKIGVWPDAYYVSYNIFANGSTFSGARVCALDRAKMLAGAAATQQCFNTSSAWGGVLPADLDGATAPPANEPEWAAAFGTNNLGIWKFHVDWTTPANSTFTGPTLLPVAAFSDACNDGTCIPQAGTTQKLDSLADRLMQRLAYRNLGDHEALVVNHSVTAGSSVGVRWYELRPTGGGGLSVFQQGTYAPDSNYRWMGSAAMDRSGDIALGFSVSGPSIHPQIHYTGRLAGDAAGQMTQGEGTIINGAGSQTGSRGLTRWGDYSSLTVDPADDCTFWYTQEYLAINGEFNWHTRIGSFKFPSCGAAAVANDFSLSATPAFLSLNQGGSGTVSVSTAVTSGSAEAVSLSVTGVPAGATASLSPTSVSSGASSTLTIDAGTAAPGTYPLTVTGTGSTATHSAAVTLTIVPNDFSLTATPASLSVNQGAGGTVSISTAVTSGAAEAVSLSVAGVPAGATASLSPTTVTSGASSTLTIAAGTAVPGTYTLTVTGTGSSATHTADVTLTIVPNDFALSAPASLSVDVGGTASGTVSTSIVSGAAETLVLSVTGVPAGASASVAPGSVTTGGTATLTVLGGTATPGTYTLTVTAAGASATHTASVSLTVVLPPPSVSAGAPVSGVEGAPVALAGQATSPVTLTTTWTVQPLSGVDAGAVCTFATASSLTTTVSCTDDGTYQLTLTAADGTNPAVAATTTLTLANAAPAIGSVSPASIAGTLGVPVSLVATFTDAGSNDTHTCGVDWGDGATSVGTVDEAAGTCTGTHAYAFGVAGTARVTISDDDGGSASSTVPVTIVDTTTSVFAGGGFGSGPARTAFALAAHYATGATVPSGALGFARPGFLFVSTSFDALSSIGGTATLRGTGYLNGIGGYSFTVTAVDSPTGDRVRLVVRRGADVVYDTGGPVPLVRGDVVVRHA